MEIVKQDVMVQTGNERMPCHVARPASGGPYPGLVVVMEAFGLNDSTSRLPTTSRPRASPQSRRTCTFGCRTTSWDTMISRAQSN